MRHSQKWVLYSKVRDDLINTAMWTIISPFQQFQKFKILQMCQSNPKKYRAILLHLCITQQPAIHITSNRIPTTRVWWWWEKEGEWLTKAIRKCNNIIQCYQERTRLRHVVGITLPSVCVTILYATFGHIFVVNCVVLVNSQFAHLHHDLYKTIFFHATKLGTHTC